MKWDVRRRGLIAPVEVAEAVRPKRLAIQLAGEGIDEPVAVGESGGVCDGILRPTMDGIQLNGKSEVEVEAAAGAARS